VSERYKKVLWQDVRVGDLVHLSNNETVPADILLLRSSNPHGVCYIETCDLDGESNLKSREVVRGFIEKQQLFSASKFTSRVEVDAPTTKIYRFHGALVHQSGERVPVSSENLLLRESRLKVSSYSMEYLPSICFCSMQCNYAFKLLNNNYFYS
jgi:phospholipid-translocating ATPase